MSRINSTNLGWRFASYKTVEDWERCIQRSMDRLGVSPLAMWQVHHCGRDQMPAMVAAANKFHKAGKLLQVRGVDERLDIISLRLPVECD